jgi:hypothetical protein
MGKEMTPNGKMNSWVADRIVVLDELIDKTRSNPEQEQYLRGVLAGIRLLQDAWLTDEFSDKEAPK